MGALLVGALALSACGGSGGSGPTTGSPGPGVSVSKPPVPTAASTPTTTQATPRTPTRGGSASATASGQVEKALEEALETALESAIRAALKENGISLSSGPDCKADLKLDTTGRSASGTVTCIATTTTGAAVKANFTGSIGVGGTCEGHLVVKVAGRTVVDENVDDCTV